MVADIALMVDSTAPLLCQLKLARHFASYFMLSEKYTRLALLKYAATNELLIKFTASTSAFDAAISKLNTNVEQGLPRLDKALETAHKLLFSAQAGVRTATPK